MNKVKIVITMFLLKFVGCYSTEETRIDGGAVAVDASADVSKTFTFENLEATAIALLSLINIDAARRGSSDNKPNNLEPFQDFYNEFVKNERLPIHEQEHPGDILDIIFERYQIIAKKEVGGYFISHSILPVWLANACAEMLNIDTEKGKDFIKNLYIQEEQRDEYLRSFTFFNSEEGYKELLKANQDESNKNINNFKIFVRVFQSIKKPFDDAKDRRKQEIAEKEARKKKSLS